MNCLTRTGSITVLVCVSTGLFAQTATPGTPPLTYNAVSDRDPRPFPPLPSIGNAGSTFIDPTFGTRVMRVTDAYTNPGASHVICNTASGGEQNSFNVDSTLFYVQ